MAVYKRIFICAIFSPRGEKKIICNKLIQMVSEHEIESETYVGCQFARSVRVVVDSVANIDAKQCNSLFSSMCVMQHVTGCVAEFCDLPNLAFRGWNYFWDAGRQGKRASCAHLWSDNTVVFQLSDNTIVFLFIILK